MRWVAAFLLAVMAPALRAQDDTDTREEANWYRVEIIVFANGEPGAGLSETWPLLPDLAYPSPAQILRRGEVQFEGDRDYSLVAVESLLPEPDFDLRRDRSIAELLWEQELKSHWRQPVIELEPLIDLRVPAAFTLLPEARREFVAQRRKLDRNEVLDVLFHESWLQPVRSRDDSKPIIIDGLATGGDFPRLQGSVLLYSGRYLHIETNLWLNTAGEYLDSDWRIPAPPTPIREEPVVIAPFKLDVAPDWLAPGPGFDVEEPVEIPEDTVNPYVGPDYSYLSIDPEPVEIDAPNEEDASPQPPPLTEAELQAFLDQPYYDFRHAVLLQQRRRMRSGELHYIDHPLFGILVKVSRYEFAPLVDAGPEFMPGLAGRR